MSGGVSANGRLRERMTALGAERGVEVIVPRPALCTDNAAMIALAGWPRLAAGERRRARRRGRRRRCRSASPWGGLMGARREAREALAAAGLRPQKRWGQHFLCDPGVVRRIVDAARRSTPSRPCSRSVPGLGALTDELAAVPRGSTWSRSIAGWPRGSRSATPASRTCASSSATCSSCRSPRWSTEPDATVVANLPYNIATPMLFRLLELRERFPRAVLMLQREVADRLAARPGGDEWGVLSVLVQTFAEVRVAFGVSRRSFLPPPHVESAVVDVRWSAAPRVDVGDVAAYRARRARGLRPAPEDAAQRARRARGRARDSTPARASRGSAARASIRASGAERLATADFARLARALEGVTCRSCPRSRRSCAARPAARRPAVVARCAVRERRLRDAGRAGLRRARSPAGASSRRRAVPASTCSRRSTTGGVWLVHLGMTGRLTLGAGCAGRRLHDHVVVRLRRRPRAHLQRPARFGRARGDRRPARRAARSAPGSTRSRRRSPARRSSRARARRRTSVKALPHGPARIAGLGNIYVNEILFRAGVRPRRRAARLAARRVRADRRGDARRARRGDPRAAARRSPTTATASAASARSSSRTTSTTAPASRAAAARRAIRARRDRRPLDLLLPALPALRAAATRLSRTSSQSRSPSPRSWSASTVAASASAGREDQVRRDQQELPSLVEHRAPRRRRRRRAEAEERQARLGDDRAREAERRLHEERRRGERQQVADDDARRGRAPSACAACDELALPERAHLARARGARSRSSRGRLSARTTLREARARARPRARSRAAGPGNASSTSIDPREQLVDPAAAPAGDGAERDADDEREATVATPDGERDARAVERAARGRRGRARPGRAGGRAPAGASRAARSVRVADRAGTSGGAASAAQRDERRARTPRARRRALRALTPHRAAAGRAQRAARSVAVFTTT